jgi:hypothetical protein
MYERTPETAVTKRVPQTPEGAQVEALTNLPEGLAIIKMDNDSMIAMAKASPRDYTAIVEDIKAQLRAFRPFAEQAMYAKPVGVSEVCPCGAENRKYAKQCPVCHQKIPQKIARGLSIRAAEALAVSYKYNRIDSTVEDIDDGDKVRLTVSFVDYQTGRVVRDSTVVSKMMRRYDGSTSRIPDDRFYSVVVKAKRSIVLRDCIMKMIPPGLRGELELCVSEQLNKLLTPETVKKLVASFASKKVTVEMLEGAIGKKLAAFDQDDKATLAGFWNSLETGEATVAELFGDDDEEADVEPTGHKVPKGYDEAIKLGDTAKAQGLIGGDGFTVRVVNGTRQVCKIISPKANGNGGTPPAETKPAEQKPEPKADPTKTPDISDLQASVWQMGQKILPSVYEPICKKYGIDIQNTEACKDADMLTACIAELKAAQESAKK